MATDSLSPTRTLQVAWVLVFAVLCYAVLRVGIGTVAAGRNPEVALKIAPNNAAALATASTRNLETLDPSLLDQAAEFARRAYIREPVSSVAFRQLAAIADVRNRPEAARTLLRESERLSRRDLLGQLMLIEEAVRREDVVGALVHYDIALRVSKRAASILFDPLAAATDDRAIVAPLTALLKRRPPWGNAYLLHAASVSPAPRNMAALMIELLRSGFPVTPPALQSLVGRLIKAGDYRTAWAVFAAMEPAARRDSIRDPRFKGGNLTDLPFDWVYNVSGSASGTLVDDAGGSRLTFNSPVGTGGVVARQMMLLPPGAYRLSALVLENNVGQSGAPVWRLRCVDGGRDVAVLTLPVVSGAARRVHTSFRAGGCDAQWLELVLAATDDPQGVAGAVTDVVITRTREVGVVR